MDQQVERRYVEMKPIYLASGMVEGVLTVVAWHWMMMKRRLQKIEAVVPADVHPDQCHQEMRSLIKTRQSFVSQCRIACQSQSYLHTW
jgi:hypothetical protein